MYFDGTLTNITDEEISLSLYTTVDSFAQDEDLESHSYNALGNMPITIAAGDSADISGRSSDREDKTVVRGFVKMEFIGGEAYYSYYLDIPDLTVYG